MPNRIIYVSDENVPLFDEVSRGDASFSQLFAAFLRQRADDLEREQRRALVDPARLCSHDTVRRMVSDDKRRYLNRWGCRDCGETFKETDPTNEFKPLEYTAPAVLNSAKTLRDEFAVAAMASDALQSAIVAAAYIAQGKRFDGDVPNLSTAAKEHYETADAMLEARKK